MEVPIADVPGGGDGGSLVFLLDAGPAAVVPLGLFVRVVGRVQVVRVVRHPIEEPGNGQLLTREGSVHSNAELPAAETSLWLKPCGYGDETMNREACGEGL